MKYYLEEYKKTAVGFLLFGFSLAIAIQYGNGKIQSLSYKTYGEILSFNILALTVVYSVGVSGFLLLVFGSIEGTTVNIKFLIFNNFIVVPLKYLSSIICPMFWVLISLVISEYILNVQGANYAVLKAALLMPLLSMVNVTLIHSLYKSNLIKISEYASNGRLVGICFVVLSYSVYAVL